jgi:hypothetical protein
MRAVALFAWLLSAAWAASGDDLVTLVNRGDADTLLQRVGHGSLPDEVNSQGQLPLVASGMCVLSRGTCSWAH